MNPNISMETLATLSVFIGTPIFFFSLLFAGLFSEVPEMGWIGGAIFGAIAGAITGITGTVSYFYMTKSDEVSVTEEDKK